MRPRVHKVKFNIPTKPANCKPFTNHEQEQPSSIPGLAKSLEERLAIIHSGLDCLPGDKQDAILAQMEAIFNREVGVESSSMVRIDSTSKT